MIIDQVPDTFRADNQERCQQYQANTGEDNYPLPYPVILPVQYVVEHINRSNNRRIQLGHGSQGQQRPGGLRPALSRKSKPKP